MHNRYHFNEGHLALPAGLKDRTVHMFAIEDDGPSEFTLVITRASQVEEPSLDAFAQRLAKELRKGLARFEMKSDLPRTVGDSPARDLAYTWRSEDKTLHQRQVVLLTHAADGSRNALQMIATTPGPLTPAWAERFEALLDSVVLREGVAVETATAAPSPEPAAHASPWPARPTGAAANGGLSRQL